MTVAIVMIGCHTQEAKHEQWTCPMHPQYVSDKPGDCPICGMKLMKKDDQKKPLFYRNPMNPADTSPTPKKDQMGMDYVPVFAESGGLDVGPEKRQLIGLKTVAVKRAPLGGGIRTTGRVSFDERRVHKVTARFEGYVEKLWADFTGKYVEKGAPLVSIYSPELLATEEELLLASRGKAALEQSGLPNAARAARDRLRLYGISDAEIERLEKRGVAERALTLSAPLSGYITSKSVVAGARVMPNDALFEIVDLSHVWLLADVYENELPRLKLGLKATLTLPYWPERKWPGRITFIAPSVDEKTRTVKVRVELDNPKGELKPEMFGDVIIDTTARSALVVPEDAVIVTGTRKVVFVGGEGALERREIQTGVHANGLYEVVSGLAEGEKVASGASFLLDSEARLRAGGDGGAQ